MGGVSVTHVCQNVAYASTEELSRQVPNIAYLREDQIKDILTGTASFFLRSDPRVSNNPEEAKKLAEYFFANYPELEKAYQKIRSENYKGQRRLTKENAILNLANTYLSKKYKYTTK